MRLLPTLTHELLPCRLRAPRCRASLPFLPTPPSLGSDGSSDTPPRRARRRAPCPATGNQSAAGRRVRKRLFTRFAQLSHMWFHASLYTPFAGFHTSTVLFHVVSTSLPD